MPPRVQNRKEPAWSAVVLLLIFFGRSASICCTGSFPSLPSAVKAAWLS